MIGVLDFLARSNDLRRSFGACDAVGLAVVSIASEEVLVARSRLTRTGGEVLGLSA